MAARPAKRQKRPVVVLSSSSESEDTSETAQTRLDRRLDQVSNNISSEKLSLSLPSRTRSGKIRTRSPAVVQPLTSSQKSKRSKKSNPEPSKSRTIHNFFTTSTKTNHISTQESDEFDAAELDDLIEDDAACEEEFHTQRAQSVSSAAGNGNYKRHTTPGARSRNEEDLTCRGSQKFIQGSKASDKAIKATGLSLSQCDEEDTRPWTEKYAPATSDELAVHKKKVDDVRKWLQDVLEGRSCKRMLILKGPSGAGKTTTVSLLSRTLKADILEWQNPRTSELPTGYLSVLGQFDDFINCDGRSASLQLRCISENQEAVVTNEAPQPSLPDGKKIILVEEIPNIFMSSSAPLQSFRAVIQQFLAQDTSGWSRDPQSAAGQTKQVIPLVLIISETLFGSFSSGDNLTVHRLLGPGILSHPAVSQIEFNPVARTFLRKALDLALLKDAKISGRRKVPGPSVLHSLGEVGDIRSALASLEFLCLRDKYGDDWGGSIAMDKIKKKAARDATPLARMEKQALQIVTQRESSLGMFHAVGKVVYNKRDEVLQSNRSLQPLAQPPSYLSQHVRNTRSQVAVNELMDQTGTDTHIFTSALHENYILSCYGTSSGESLDAVNGCIDSLSDSDLLGTSYGGRSYSGASSSGPRGEASGGVGKDSLRQDEICFQTAVRGILFSLPFPVKRSPPSLPTQAGLRKPGPTSRKGDAHKMFYPAALKIWRQKEEIEGVVNTWIKRFNEGLRPLSSCNSRSKAGSGTLKSSKSNLTVTSEKSSDNTLPCVGISGRSQMTLERLPYIGKILRSSSLPSTAQLLDIEKVTMFRGIGVQSEEISDFEDQLREDASTNGKRVKHGIGASKHIQNGRRMDNESILQQEVVSLGPSFQMDVQAEKLVLSDDDIEDD